MSLLSIMSVSMRQAQSIDLNKFMQDDENYRNEDMDEDDMENERDQFEMLAQSSKNTWNEGGHKKDKVLNTLIKHFAMLIQKKPDKGHLRLLEDVPADAVFSKLPKAIDSLRKIIKYVTVYCLDGRKCHLISLLESSI